MPGNSILDENNVQYVAGPQTLKDIVNTRIPFLPPQVFSSVIAHWSLAYRTDRVIHADLESDDHWINVIVFDCVN